MRQDIAIKAVEGDASDAAAERSQRSHLAEAALVAVLLADPLELRVFGAVEAAVTGTGKFSESPLELRACRTYVATAPGRLTKMIEFRFPKRYRVCVNEPLHSLNDSLANPLDLVEAKQPVQQDERPRRMVELNRLALRP